MRALILVLAALMLAACSTTQRLDAAGDVHSLLIAIRDGDQERFNAHIDRTALKRQLEARLLAEASNRDGGQGGVAALASVFAGPLANLAGDALLRPQVFRSVAEYYGYRPDQPIPGQLAIAGALRALPDGRVCATRRREGPCLLTFASEDGTWRLVSFDGDRAMLNMGRR